MNFKKANIVVVTLFITIVVGVIGLIVTKYIFNLTQISSENLKYYKAYYVAYAGIETELLKMKNHGLGFEDIILSSGDTVRKNFSGKTLSFQSRIYSLSKKITSNPKSLIYQDIDYCSNKKNWIKLSTGEAFMFPLIYDKNETEAKITGLNYKSLQVGLSDIDLHYSGDLVVSYQSNNEKVVKNIGGDDDIKTLNSIIDEAVNYSVENNPFIVIGAKSNSLFCIDSFSSLVSYYSYIQSKGNFINRTVYLKVVKKHKWANFTIYGIY